MSDLKMRLNELVPAHMHGGLIRYLEQGIMPGGFLSAVLTNDLKRACASADHINIRRIPDIVSFLYNFAPGPCWGSEEKVTEWVRRFEAQDAGEAR